MFAFLPVLLVMEQMLCEYSIISRGVRCLTPCRNTECDYSSAYITLLSDSDLVGHGMTFTIGRGNDIVRLYFYIKELVLTYPRSAVQCVKWQIVSSGRTQSLYSRTWAKPGNT